MFKPVQILLSSSAWVLLYQKANSWEADKAELLLSQPFPPLQYGQVWRRGSGNFNLLAGAHVTRWLAKVQKPAAGSSHRSAEWRSCT